jgi:hypothetical protein
MFASENDILIQNCGLPSGLGDGHRAAIPAVALEVDVVIPIGRLCFGSPTEPFGVSASVGSFRGDGAVSAVSAVTKPSKPAIPEPIRVNAARAPNILISLFAARLMPGG